MGLIKSSEISGAMVRLSLRDIEADAQATLDRASQEGQSILSRARAEADGIREAARAEGFAAGEADGIARGLDQGRAQALERHSVPLGELIQSLSAATLELAAARKRLEENLHREAVDLALVIARRITKRQAEIDPQVLTANLREALSLIGRSSEMRIAIHPAQKTLLEAAMEQLAIEWPTVMAAVVFEDESLLPGDCRVFTHHGQIDAALDGQLQRIAREILPEVK